MQKEKMILPTFILEVRNICDEYYDEGASHAKIEITPKTYDMIKKAQRFVKKMKGYSFTTFDDTPVFLNSGDDDTYTENETMIIEALELKVTEGTIYWSGVIKRTSIEVYTDGILIAELDHGFKTLKKPLEDLPLMINNCKYESSKEIAKERLKHGR